jgi:bifunctional non-homologous end joining protein LigD
MRTDTGLRPQLLNSIDEDEALTLLQDPNWLIQEKLDGRHVVIKNDRGVITAANKQGLETQIPEEVINSVKYLNAVFDGELVDGVFHCFDLLELKGTDLKHLSYKYRLNYLTSLTSTAFFRIVPSYFDNKLEIFNRFKAEGKEGVVFKRFDASFTEGRPNTGGDMLKCKFVNTLSAIVSEGETGKNSFYYHVLDSRGNKIPLGSCTVGVKTRIPVAGDVVEIRYLYGHRGGCLNQPVFLDLRDDVDPCECVESQIKYKGEAYKESKEFKPKGIKQPREEAKPKKKSSNIFAKYKTYTGERGSTESWTKAAKKMLHLEHVDSDLVLLGLKDLPKTKAELKKAYFIVMHEVHPDKGGSNDDAANATQAYERLLTKF